MTRAEKLKVIQHIKDGMPVDLALKFGGREFFILVRDTDGTYLQDNEKLTLKQARELNCYCEKYGIKVIKAVSVAGMTREQIDELNGIVDKELSYNC